MILAPKNYLLLSFHWGISINNVIPISLCFIRSPQLNFLKQNPLQFHFFCYFLLIKGGYFAHASHCLSDWRFGAGLLPTGVILGILHANTWRLDLLCGLLNYAYASKYLTSVTDWNKFVLPLNLICWNNFLWIDTECVLLLPDQVLVSIEQFWSWISSCDNK